MGRTKRPRGQTAAEAADQARWRAKLLRINSTHDFIDEGDLADLSAYGCMLAMLTGHNAAKQLLQTYVQPKQAAVLQDDKTVNYVANPHYEYWDADQQAKTLLRSAVQALQRVYEAAGVAVGDWDANWPGECLCVSASSVDVRISIECHPDINPATHPDQMPALFLEVLELDAARYVLVPAQPRRDGSACQAWIALPVARVVPSRVPRTCKALQPGAQASWLRQAIAAAATAGSSSSAIGDPGPLLDSVVGHLEIAARFAKRSAQALVGGRRSPFAALAAKGVYILTPSAMAKAVVTAGRMPLGIASFAGLCGVRAKFARTVGQRRVIYAADGRITTAADLAAGEQLTVQFDSSTVEVVSGVGSDESAQAKAAVKRSCVKECDDHPTEQYSQTRLADDLFGEECDLVFLV